MRVYDCDSKFVIYVPRYHVAEKGGFPYSGLTEDTDVSLLVLGCDLEKFFVYVGCADGVGEHDGSLPLWIGRWERGCFSCPEKSRQVNPSSYVRFY